MSAVLDFCLTRLAADPNVSPAFKRAVLRPVFTVADEPLIHFVIFDGYDDADLPTTDDFHVNRKEAASILRRQHREGAYIERRGAGYYIEPKDAA